MSTILPPKLYFKVFAALLALLALTWALAYIDLGAMNLGLAMAISVAKALVIVLFFMHVRYASRLIAIVACAGFFWLLILLGMTMTDYHSRGWLPTRRPDIRHFAGDRVVADAFPRPGAPSSGPPTAMPGAEH